jgi:hypothetical protein
MKLVPKTTPDLLTLTQTGFLTFTNKPWTFNLVFGVSILRAFSQVGSALLENNSPLLQESEFLLLWLEAPMVEPVRQTTRDANTDHAQIHRDGTPIPQVPFRKA